MKRLPLVMSFIAVVALSASLAYWALQLFKPTQRPIAVAMVQRAPEVSLDAAAGLFGGQAVAVAVSNYQLKGVVAAANGRRSVAILALDGKPPQAVPVGREIVSGVTLKEVFPKHVLLSEGGVIKRVELVSDTAISSERAMAPPIALPAPTYPAPVAVPVPVPGQPQAPTRMTLSPATAVPPAAGADQTR